MGIILSGSSDGSAIISTIRHGRYLRTLVIDEKTNASIDFVETSEKGHCVLYSKNELIVFTMNNVELSRLTLEKQLIDMKISFDCQSLLLQFDDCLEQRKLFDLSIVEKKIVFQSSKACFFIEKKKSHSSSKKKKSKKK